MDILEFIFILGVNFSIFGFIWGILTFGVKLLRGPATNKNQVEVYVLRIAKYFFLVSVTAYYIHTFQDADVYSKTGLTQVITGTIVMALYLLGKLQNRTMMSVLSQTPFLGPFSAPPIDLKVERWLLLGSLVYFVICLLVPTMVDNRVIIWFSESIISIYNAVIIGWIFKVIAFFFLINIIFRGANVIGRLLNGEPILASPNVDFNFNGGTNPFEQFRQKQANDPEWTDYEDVTDEYSDEEENKD